MAEKKAAEPKKKEVCPDCGQIVTYEPAIGFGKEAKKRCGCKDPFQSNSTTGWGS